MRDTEDVPASQATPQHWTPLPKAWRSAAFEQPGAVLLESTLPSATEHRSFLFRHPQRLLVANTPEEILAVFAAIEAACSEGKWAAGWIDYEAGYHFLTLPSRPIHQPLAIFGVYGAPNIFDHTDVSFRSNAEASVSPAPLRIAAMPTITREAYRQAIHQIHQWIAAGETYQVNYTTRLTTPCPHTAEEVYEALRAQQPSSYSAIVNLTEAQALLSLSPELFFRTTSDGRITTRPMKGTAPRSDDPSQDQALATALRNDEKNRAEHVMIVDLLRNDFNRICTIGSVHVEDLFHIESLRTVHQMTSTIHGQLPSGTSWYEVFRALFPGGSITGAPKRHTVELIHTIEPEPRGVYTGAIGYFAPDRSACFNIAIRTAVLADNHLSLGAGGGIVADSTPAAEYSETLLKSSFVQRASQPIQIIETMRVVNGTVPLLAAHLHRLETAANALDFAINKADIREQIAAAIRRKPGAPHLDSEMWEAAKPPHSRKAPPQRLRLLLHRNGDVELNITEAPSWPAEIHLRLASTATRPGSPHLRHKTTFRPEYEPAYAAAIAAGYDDALFFNTDEQVTETCIANLLVQLHGQWFTPPLRCGVLPGIYRQHLLATGNVTERSITLQDLRNASAAGICNAVRGSGNVTSLQLPDGKSIHWESTTNLPTLAAW